MDFWKKHNVLILLFVIAFSLRLIFALPSLNTPQLSGSTITADGYYEITQNLLQGNGFSRSAINAPAVVPDSVRMPLYPLLIAFMVWLTGNFKIFLLFQIVIGSFIPILARKIAFMLTAKDTIAIMVGLFLALEPLNAWLSTFLLTETFFTFFFLSACIYFLSYLDQRKIFHLALCGLLLGVATLVRPTTQFLPILLAILLLIKHWQYRREIVKAIFVFLLVFYCTLTPWMVRNYNVFGSAALNVQSTSILYAFFVPSVIALEEHISFGEAQRKFTGSDNIGGIEDVNLGNSAEYKKQALRELQKHPVGIAKSLWTTFYAFFTNDGYRAITPYYPLLSFDAPGVGMSQILKQPKDFIPLFASPGIQLIIFGRLLWITISMFFFVGLYLFIKEKEYSAPSLFVALLLCYFLATTALVGLAVNGRFRIPVEVFIITLALYSFQYFMYRFRTKAET